MNYVALFDILGYQDIINNNPTDKLNNIYDNILRDLQHLLSNGKRESTGKAIVPILGENVKVNSCIVSDTIILWTDDVSPELFINLLNIVQYFCWFNFQYPGIFVRGAITVGEVIYRRFDFSTENRIINHSTAYGKGIVKAYKLEQNQKWAGCIVDKEAVNFFFSTSDGKLQSEFDNLTTQYSVPLKVRASEGLEYVIDWVQKDRIEAGVIHEDARSKPDYIREQFKSHNKSVDEFSVKEKIENTIEFLRYVKQTYNSIQPG